MTSVIARVFVTSRDSATMACARNRFENRCEPLRERLRELHDGNVSRDPSVSSPPSSIGLRAAHFNTGFDFTYGLLLSATSPGGSFVGIERVLAGSISTSGFMVPVVQGVRDRTAKRTSGCIFQRYHVLRPRSSVNNLRTNAEGQRQNRLRRHHPSSQLVCRAAFIPSSDTPLRESLNPLNWLAYLMRSRWLVSHFS